MIQITNWSQLQNNKSYLVLHKTRDGETWEVLEWIDDCKFIDKGYSNDYGFGEVTKIYELLNI